MSVVEKRDRGREAFARRRWADAYSELAAVAQDARTGPEDLDLLATSALLLGRDEEAVDLIARAYQGFIAVGDGDRAARSAFWAGLTMFESGNPAQAAGWFARVQRLVDDGVGGSAAAGYLEVARARGDMVAGRTVEAMTAATAALAHGERAGDQDLAALGKMALGATQVMQGERSAGLAVLDEVMVAVTSGEVSSMPAGIIYCGVLGVCAAALDVGRAREWTEALTRWCESQPDLVPFRGECLAHRSLVMRHRGAWQDCMAEAGRALERLTGLGAARVAGAAWYQQAEVLRLRGETAAAETAYRTAADYGVDPQPGLALLRLAQGAVDDAAASIRRACDEPGDLASQSATLAAAVEILLTAGDAEGARTAAQTLAQVARTAGAPVLTALAGQARGAVLLAAGEPRPALESLRAAWAAWQRLDDPYEVARTRVLLAQACRALDDRDGARLELDAARRTFRRLGADPDLVRVDQELALVTPDADAPGGLTPREVEVLRLVATGRTNRAVAAQLFLSEKTVARHLSNIFTKLDLTSRSAVTAYAYEHHLV
ncbi:helix-turn-helix transcriptional regulator [Georgenia subflava]|uniref:HTH luxR-type domain-containing protein n=1 Tax=Georgenia subflava TaxID=1622177 RepID=A0A6N7ELZ3_9MICO|nr:helix-turn-helix transcriptional regulator [Georgenia subflava]MPV38461.1 hypothetical protein [Georgenia subflava]